MGRVLSTRFVKQSKGQVKIYREEGHGSTFRIYLPCVAADLRAEPVDIPLKSPVVGRNETILVVEDDALVRTHATNLPHGLGYRTISAANAAEALAIVDSGATYYLLFTDVIMPGPMNGSRLTKTLARRDAKSRAPFTSGYPENAVVHHGRVGPGVGASERGSVAMEMRK